MTIIGHMVTRNELDRYLPATLDWLAELTEGRLLVYDDSSEDGTANYVNERRLPLVVRDPTTTPSFAEDESACRGAAWRALEQALRPSTADWILCVDADEFPVTTAPGPADPQAVRDALDRATRSPERSVTFKVAEVFGAAGNGEPMIRTDGYWGSITACRLVQWRPAGRFHPRREGGGSIPSSWPRAMRPEPDLALLHYGYAQPEDRDTRYARYRYGEGHNPVHIASINRQPRLTPWTGMQPPTLPNRP